MAIISFKEGIIVDFVPSYGGNREDKVKTIVGIKPLNNNGAIDFMDVYQKKVLDSGDENEKATISKEVARQSFIDHVAYVKNYQMIGKDDEVIDIETGDQLYDNASKGLINEISLAIENSSRLSEGQAKNFEGDSAGSGK